MTIFVALKKKEPYATGGVRLGLTKFERMIRFGFLRFKENNIRVALME